MTQGDTPEQVPALVHQRRPEIRCPEGLQQLAGGFQLGRRQNQSGQTSQGMHQRTRLLCRLAGQGTDQLVENGVPCQRLAGGLNHHGQPRRDPVRRQRALVDRPGDAGLRQVDGVALARRKADGHHAQRLGAPAGFRRQLPLVRDRVGKTGQSTTDAGTLSPGQPMRHHRQVPGRPALPGYQGPCGLQSPCQMIQGFPDNGSLSPGQSIGHHRQRLGTPARAWRLLLQLADSAPGQTLQRLLDTGSFSLGQTVGHHGQPPAGP